MSAVGITNFASQLVFWIPILGAGTGLMRGKTAMVLMAACWGVLMLFQLVTLPVEFDASRRAKRWFLYHALPLLLGGRREDE